MVEDAVGPAAGLAGFGCECMSDDLATDPFETRNGCEFRVPSRPGLGIAVDRAKLERYTVRMLTLQAEGRAIPRTPRAFAAANRSCMLS